MFRSPSSFFPTSQHPALKRLASAHPQAGDWIAALGDREWPVVIEHGDFAPWNLLRTPAGLRAIDWEDARLQGFVGFDLVHYVIQTGFLMHHWDAVKIRAYAEARLQDAGLTSQEAAVVVKLAALQDIVVSAEGEQAALQSIRQNLLLLGE